jgi:hypothetical protein
MSEVTSVNSKTGAVVLKAADVEGVPTSEIGQPSGVASLDGSGKLPEAQLTSSVVSSSAAFAGGQIETNARAFGVKREGEAHDDYSAMQQAIEHAQNTGTPLVLPGGTVSEPVVIYLGAGGEAYGGLKIAAGKPLTIRGPGKGCCHFLLSRYCPRLFDFDPLGLQNQNFDGIEMSGFTVDAGNVTYEVLAPPTEVTETKAIPGAFAKTKIKLTSNANFQGATAGVWFVTQERSMSAKPIEGSTTEIEVTNGGAELHPVEQQHVFANFRPQAGPREAPTGASKMLLRIF